MSCSPSGRTQSAFQKSKKHPLKVIHSFHWRSLRNISGGLHRLLKPTLLELRSRKIQRWSCHSMSEIQHENHGARAYSKIWTKESHNTHTQTPTFEGILRNDIHNKYEQSNPSHLNTFIKTKKQPPLRKRFSKALAHSSRSFPRPHLGMLTRGFRLPRKTPRFGDFTWEFWGRFGWVSLFFFDGVWLEQIYRDRE